MQLYKKVGTAAAEPVAEEPATENSVEPAAENEPEVDTSAEFTARIESLEAEKVEMEKKISDITNENESLIAFKKAMMTCGFF